MEGWKERLLEKVNTVFSHKDKLSTRSMNIVCKIKTILESGAAPSWNLHKMFTEVRVRLVAKLGAKDREMKKHPGVHYYIGG